MGVGQELKVGERGIETRRVRGKVAAWTGSMGLMIENEKESQIKRRRQ